MTQIPDGTELPCPFLPAKDFDPSGVLWHISERRKVAVQD